MPSKRGPKPNRYHRRLKSKRLEYTPEMKARILGSVIKRSGHWTLDPDDLGLPTPNQGSRRIVFEATYGPVSPTSEVYSTCYVNQCVNPGHCKVENVETEKLRKAGKLPRLIFSSGRTVCTVEDYERTLRTTKSQQKTAYGHHDQAVREKQAADAKKAAIALSICSVEDP